MKRYVGDWGNGCCSLYVVGAGVLGLLVLWRIR